MAYDRKFNVYTKRVTRKKRPVDPHRYHRQGDEIACSCGKRWSLGETHPWPLAD